MEHKTPGVGSPAAINSASGNGSPEQENAVPRRKRSRSGKRAEQDQVELTVAGAAWRPSGAGHALVVMARGHGAGHMRSSFATLIVFRSGHTHPVTAPVTVIGDEGDVRDSRQTLRFVFRLPASAPTWPIERMVLRWSGTEVELPPPAQPPIGAPGAESELFRTADVGLEPGAAAMEIAPEEAVEPTPEAAEVTPQAAEVSQAADSPMPEPDEASEPVERASVSSGAEPEPVSGRYGPGISESEHDLASLREEIIGAKLELAQLHAEIAETRLQYEEASIAREYAERERDRAQQWLADVTGEIEDVERQLAECRRELDHVSRELAARRAPRGEEPQDESAEKEVRGKPVEEEARRKPAPGAAGGDDLAAAERDLNAAVSQLRSKLEQVLSQPRPPVIEERILSEGHDPPTPAEEVPVEQQSEEELPVMHTTGADVSAQDLAVPPEGAPTETAEEEGPPARTPASLPGRIDREDGESSWFAAALRRLAADDREAAGRVLVSLLPAQAIATPRTFHYDLVVRDDTIYAVDAHPLDTRVQEVAEPRPMDQTDAWIMGTLDQLGDLIVHGKSGFLRLFNRHGLKVKGQRARLDDLLALATAPLRLRDLCAVGAPIQPQLLLQMIVSSIDPSWVDGCPLSIRFDPQEDEMSECSFRIQDGSPVVLGVESTAAADFGELSTIAEGSARSLMRLLAGLPSPEGDQATVRGPVEPLEMLQGWVRRLELSSL